jgi:hypothetical protein
LERQIKLLSERVGQRSNTVLILDADRQCIGISARPMWADGAYRVEFESADDLQLLRAHLGESF